MSSIILTGDTSGTLTVSAPLVAGSNTLTLAAATGTIAPLVSGTTVASTSGTSIDFTSIPSWVKRITVMFNAVSTNGTSNYQVQIGSGSVTTTGYVSGSGVTTSTTGFLACTNLSASTLQSGTSILTTLGSNVWVNSATVGASGGNATSLCNGYITLGGTLDRVRITTVNGTDTFDAGSINILYE